MKKGFFGEVFGQFVTSQFWKDLLRTIVHEMIIAFIMALGGALMWYGKKRADPNMHPATMANTPAYGFSGGGPYGSSQPSSPFGRYGSSAPVTPTSEGGFPGFGPR